MPTAREIMYQGDQNGVVDATACLRDVLEEMNRKLLGAVCVVENGKLVGLITDGDIRRLLLNTQKPLPHLFLTSASELMVKSPKSVGVDTSLEECLGLLVDNRFWVVPVVDKENNLKGLIHLHALLKSKGVRS